MPELAPDDMPLDAPELMPDEAPDELMPEELPPPELLMLEPEELEDMELGVSLVGVLPEPLEDIGPLLDGVCVVPGVLLVNASVV
jgi:hypothetical protein